MKTLISFAFLTIASVALAAGNSGARSIAAISVEAGYFAMVYGTTAFDNPDACGNSTMAMLPASNAGYKEMLAVALSAFAAEKNVSFWLNGCVATPWGFTVPQIYSIAVSR